MKGMLLTANHMLLMLCASMYLGTGGSLVFFSFPVAPQLTVDNYYLQLVPQIASATAFFTTMTKLMIATCLVMVIAEWRRPDRWVAIVVLAAILVATGVEVKWIMPLSERMAERITGAAELRQVLGEWMQLNRVRLALWCVQWLAMAWYFARWTYRARYAALGR